MILTRIDVSLAHSKTKKKLTEISNGLTFTRAFLLYSVLLATTNITTTILLLLLLLGC